MIRGLHPPDHPLPEKVVRKSSAAARLAGFNPEMIFYLRP